MKQKRQPALSSLKRLRAKAVFLRDNYRCVRCGRTTALAPSHIYPQGRYPRMAWILENILTMCFACHIMWWHKHPIEASKWFNQTYPELALQLHALSLKTLPPINRTKIKQQLNKEIIKYELQRTVYQGW